MRKFSEKKRKFSDRIKMALKKHQSPKYLREIKYEQIQDWVDENKMKKDNISDPIEQYDNHDLGYPIEQDIYDRMQTWVRDHFEWIRNREDLLDKADIAVRDYLFDVFPNYRQAFPLLNKGITESKITPTKYTEPTSFADHIIRFRREHKAQYITSFITVGKNEIQLDLVEGCEYGKGNMFFIKNSDNPKIKTKFSDKVPFNNLVYIEFLDDKNNENFLFEKIEKVEPIVNKDTPRSRKYRDPNQLNQSDKEKNVNDFDKSNKERTDDKDVENKTIDPNTEHNKKGHRCILGYYEVVGKIKFNNVDEIYGKEPLGYKNLINPEKINEGIQDNIKKGFSKAVDTTKKAIKNTGDNIYKYADEKAKKYGGKLYNDLTKKDFNVSDFDKKGILFDFGDDDKIGLKYNFKISKNNCLLANKKAQYETYFYGIDNIINYVSVAKALGLGNKKGDSENCLLAIPNKTYKFPNDESEDFFYIIKRKIYQECIFKLSKEEEETTNTKEEEKVADKKDNKKEDNKGKPLAQPKDEFLKRTAEELKVHDIIEHPEHGIGEITEIRDDGDDGVAIEVSFKDKDRTILLPYAKLKIKEN